MAPLPYSVDCPAVVGLRRSADAPVLARGSRGEKTHNV